MVVGCSDQKNMNEVQEIMGTENVDNGLKIDHIELSSYNRREYGDIIGKLFTEELKSNEKLRVLFEKINSIDKDIIDSTLTTNKYLELNDRYFRSAKHNINSLKDSTLRKKVYKIFEKEELEHNIKLSPHKNYLSEIGRDKRLLHDKKILLKLFITLPLIQKYQSEKMPNTNQLKNIKKDMEVLIIEAEKLINIK